MNERTIEWTDGRLAGWLDVWMDGWVDMCLDASVIVYDGWKEGMADE